MWHLCLHQTLAVYFCMQQFGLQCKLFCSLHFGANDFLVLGLHVWAVTSAVTAWFSCENIFGFDIPTKARNW